GVTQEGAAALWGGRFDEGMAPALLPRNLSLDVDRRLWRHDVQGSRARARALGGAGVRTDDEVAALLRGLAGVAARLATHGVPLDAAGEDLHSLVERLPTEEAGEVALKLPTGRSRNAQVATALRLWARDVAE